MSRRQALAALMEPRKPKPAINCQPGRAVAGPPWPNRRVSVDCLRVVHVATGDYAPNS